MYHPFIQFDPTHPVLSFAADELARHLAMLPEAALSGPVQLIVCDSLSDHGFSPPQTNEDDQYAFAVTSALASVPTLLVSLLVVSTISSLPQPPSKSIADNARAVTRENTFTFFVIF